MNPLLIAANMIVALMGVAFMAVAQRVPGRVPKFLTGFTGLALLVLAIMNLPGQTLSRVRPTEVAPPPSEPTTPQEPPPADTQEKIIYVGDLDALAQAISERMRPGGIEETEETTLLAERDPFMPASLSPDDSVLAKEPTTPVPEPPKVTAERTLPQESTAPSCTSFELLHGKSGGPEPSGCYAVGCAEGYALPMQLQGGAWSACEKYSRLPRLDSCYIITDHDGTQRSMRFINGSWKPGTCS